MTYDTVTEVKSASIDNRMLIHKRYKFNVDLLLL